MPEWMFEVIQNNEKMEYKLLLVRATLALLAGFVVQKIYLLLPEKSKVENRHTFPITLLFLTILITFITIVIGNSVARAFGLVGALSIVRFRTVVEDTRDTAFVIFAVVVGMAIGAGYALVAVAIILSMGMIVGILRLYYANYPLLFFVTNQLSITLEGDSLQRAVPGNLGSEQQRSTDQRQIPNHQRSLFEAICCRIEEILKNYCSHYSLCAYEFDAASKSIKLKYEYHTPQINDLSFVHLSQSLYTQPEITNIEIRVKR